MQVIKDFIIANANKVLTTAILIVGTFLIFLVVGLLVGRFVKKNKDRRKRAVTLAKMTQSLFRYVFVIIILIIILDVWGLNVMPILAGAGIAGIALGFGAQNFIKDLLAGMAIVFENYFDIDDIIEINGFKGKVIEIGLKSTKIENWKGEIKIFFNGDLKEITNYSKNPSTGIAEIVVDYRENIDKVRTLLEEKLVTLKDAFPQILEGPNILGITKLDASGYTIRITVKTLSETQYSVEREMYRFIKELFEESGIRLATGSLVVRHDDQSK